MKMRKSIHLFLSSAALVAASGLLAGAAQAAAFDIAQDPLFVASNVPPNIIMAIDDSGSMDSEVLMPTNDGALWWNTVTQSFVGLGRGDAVAAGVINYNEAGVASATWKKYVYLFPNGTGGITDGQRAYADSTHDHYAVPPRPEFAFLRSPDYNAAYYDPNETYLPWASTDTYTFGDVDPANAPYDPVFGTNRIDLTSDLTNQNNGWTFKLHDGMRGEDGTLVTAINKPAERFTYYPATYYVQDASLKYYHGGSPRDCSAPNPQWYQDFMADPTKATGVDAIGPDGACLRKVELKAGDAELQNFANWFTYYRKRHLAMRGGVGLAFDGLGALRVAMFRFNYRVNANMFDIDTQRSEMLTQLYTKMVGNGGTPTRESLDHAGKQFSRTDSGRPIIAECQQNFAMVFTDGFAVPSAGLAGNVDGAAGAPYADAHDGTLGDIAMKYYTGKLRTDLPAGRVPVPAGCNSTPPDPRLDCNRDLHVNTYAVGMGAQGDTIFGVTHNVVADAYANPPSWQNPTTSRHPVQVDDLYHAAVNGRGEMLNAQTPTEIQSKMAQALSKISDSVGSASAVATNSTRLDTDTLIYQARFDTKDWSGQLLAFAVNADGSVGALTWDAAQQMPSHTNRDIYTWNPVQGGGSGVSFAWNSLANVQKDALDTNSDGVNDGLGQARLAYLRGDASQERNKAGGIFRIRPHALGDIINSDPAFVGGPRDYGFRSLSPDIDHPEASTYPAFLETLKTRTPVVYVGANDGMLHAFNAETGREMFAYVPNVAFPMLSRLTSPDYGHRYYVDGSPRSNDAYLNGAWKTVLLGALGAGGPGVYALDVTSPSSFGAGNVLWEFTHPDVGYVLGQPTVARLASGRWVALIGNGYNSAGANADPHVAKLVIVDLATGAHVKTLSTKVGSAASPNGLAAPVPVDVNGDRITDYVYAGDMQGNLWKFDLRAGNENWGFGFGNNNNPRPLFRAVDAAGNPQPITSRPNVGKHPDGGVMVLFGTGKYFETSDNVVVADPKIQTFYGVRDNNSEVSRTDLVEQTIIYEASATEAGTSFAVRAVSANEVDYAAKDGWYLDLVSPNSGTEGERVVDAPILRFGRVIFTTIIPSNQVCDYGGRSWLMELDMINGARLSYNVFDTNGDGIIDNADFIIIDGVPVPVSGKGSDELISSPGIISAGGGEGTGLEYKYTSGSSGNIEVTTEHGGGEFFGRQSWRQDPP